MNLDSSPPKQDFSLKSRFKDDDRREESRLFEDQPIIAILKFFSKIKEGEKLYVKGATPSTGDHSLATSILRTLFYREESRVATFKFIKSKIEEAFKLVSLGDHKREDLLECIADSKTGIYNLIKTYHKDIFFTSQLEALISAIDRGISLEFSDAE